MYIKPLPTLRGPRLLFNPVNHSVQTGARMANQMIQSLYYH